MFVGAILFLFSLLLICLFVISVGLCVREIERRGGRGRWVGGLGGWLVLCVRWCKGMASGFGNICLCQRFIFTRWAMMYRPS